MHCRFLSHGMAVSYDKVVKPCCVWTYDSAWGESNTIGRDVDLVRWHSSESIKEARNLMQLDIWPKSCVVCENAESQHRASMRLNANRSQQYFTDQDISLEIRPGSTCNFACQTCWPAASSRVAAFHHKAGLIDITSLDSQDITDFSFLDPIKHRIKQTMVLGGEPFYDKNCQRFLSWAKLNLLSEMVMFTNGSAVDFDWIAGYEGKVTLVFSLDAIGKPAEYIRFGTVWSEVVENFLRCQNLSNVEVRANITVSVYNYVYLRDLIDFLCAKWPSVVSFGYPDKQNTWMNASCIPMRHRSGIVAGLQDTLLQIQSADIVLDQKQHAQSNFDAIISMMQNQEFDPDSNKKFKDFATAMDTVKNIRLRDHCPELFDIIWD